MTTPDSGGNSARPELISDYIHLGKKNTVTRHNSRFLKAVIIFLLTIVMLYPTSQIFTIIDEREARQSTVETDVTSKWSGSQQLTGPYLSIPYTVMTYDSTLKKRSMDRYYIHVLPEQLTVDATLKSQTLHRSMYEIPVYSSQITLGGRFSELNPSLFNQINPESILWEESMLCMGISDLRGLKESVYVNMNGMATEFQSGLPERNLCESGMTAPMPLTSERRSLKQEFSVTLDLKGSNKLMMIPLGKNTEVRMTSDWTTPSFDGAFLPETREITSAGFTAMWKKHNLNRNYPQVFYGKAYYDDIQSSAFGVILKAPVAPYQQITRAVKYAILVIGLSFLLFFIIEVLVKKSVHPFQYLLIGFALVLFYALLLSVCEYAGFTIAYSMASTMTVLLVAFYTQAVLRDFLFSALIAGLLMLLYAFMFVIVQLEDYALLTGSIGLFIILAVVMYYTRNINWSGDMESAT
ncbi:MAG: cell envelope integrity protein CreD [Candidatus Kapabacteria bacterium]|nr:cell envelope integrity protein CreD [Candidatus Kapabacteria bacterium]